MQPQADLAGMGYDGRVEGSDRFSLKQNAAYGLENYMAYIACLIVGATGLGLAWLVKEIRNKEEE